MRCRRGRRVACVRWGGCVKRGSRSATGWPRWWTPAPRRRARSARGSRRWSLARSPCTRRTPSSARRAGRPAARARCARSPRPRARNASPAMSRGCCALARGMRAAALEHDSSRLQRARARAQARVYVPVPGRYSTRLPQGPRVEVAEQRRCRVRDLVLLEGSDPAAWPNAALALARLPALVAGSVRLLGPDRCEELDGVGARAARYRAELERGRWRLPHLRPPDGGVMSIDPEEGSPR